ncbi:hypothetical protein AXG93_509s1390 [Marchantia polymorpha subsp. ruderalis]|uniref:Uncharacterized protein n=1 Tax=Marchantia polymorpha subsp. ruderalis TaxID=1480154 RepID=A0A176WC43_MARPO|nr:hypothetical protein AXG93_509s1390 [Marchantia polymorpha subsp. ruderalis]
MTTLDVIPEDWSNMGSGKVKGSRCGLTQGASDLGTQPPSKSSDEPGTRVDSALESELREGRLQVSAGGRAGGDKMRMTKGQLVMRGDVNWAAQLSSGSRPARQKLPMLLLDSLLLLLPIASMELGPGHMADHRLGLQPPMSLLLPEYAALPTPSIGETAKQALSSFTSPASPWKRF